VAPETVMDSMRGRSGPAARPAAVTSQASRATVAHRRKVPKFGFRTEKLGFGFMTVTR
jgi:hypothetical protein